MAFCVNCGTSLKEGAVFCHECGSRYDAGQQSAPSVPPPVQSPPPPMGGGYVPPQPSPQFIPPTMGYQQPPPPPPVYHQPPLQPQQSQGQGKVTFEVVPKEMLRLLMVKLESSAFRYESGGMYYMQGQLAIEAQLPSAGGFLKSMVTKESAVKPVIRGTGTVFLEPSFGEFTIMELRGGRVDSG